MHGTKRRRGRIRAAGFAIFILNWPNELFSTDYLFKVLFTFNGINVYKTCFYKSASFYVSIHRVLFADTYLWFSLKAVLHWFHHSAQFVILLGTWYKIRRSWLNCKICSRSFLMGNGGEGNGWTVHMYRIWNCNIILGHLSRT